MTTTTLTMAKALNAGLRKALENDPKVLLMGEDIGKLGGVFRITDGLQKDFGADRVIDSPLAESAIVGTAVGLAIRGYRPVCEIQFDGFVFPAFDQIVSQVAKLRSRTEGVYRMGIVIRLPFAGGIGAVEHHSESPEAYFAHTAGLRVVSCSTPHDAYWMIQEAIAHDDPIIFCEPKCRYWEKGDVDLDSPGRGLFEANVLREGTDVTVVAWGPSVKTSLRAAEVAATEGHAVEVIDARSVAPLDLATLVASVTKTGRLIVVHEAPPTASIGADIIRRVSEECFYSLRAPGLQVSGYHTPYPPARIEDAFRPSVDRILDAVDRSLGYGL
jgi:pyruvate dehydrogenase E1 component beta subunit